ncbi:MAG: GAF domain-containing sensor histidine kinase, partial [Planctomycetota bacterium]|nr:GAF domain-containing sensor histidine kinase [Planctomycetota bacterium]
SIGRPKQGPAAKGPGRFISHDRRAAEELDAVLTVSRALGGKLDLQGVLGVALEEVAEIAGAEGASILLIDPETSVMRFYLAAGPGADAAKSVPLPPGEGICGHTVRTGEPFIVNDAQNDPRLYRRVDNTTGVTTRNILCVPLRSNERLWGVLELINKHGGADFDKHDLSLAEAVGAQIALALENAHLHAEGLRKERMAAVGRTVSGLAHCVKNVLNGIRSGSAVVDRSLAVKDFDRVNHGWGVVSKNFTMLSNLVLDMLSLAREANCHPFPTDVNDLAEQVCQLMTDRAAERGIDVGFVPAENLQEVMTDPTQIYRCLLNLLTNAVDAGREGGRVAVRIYRGPGRPRLTISVADNGAGISPENRSKLFREFFTTKGNHGTGLGLPVTKKLINALGGTIKFHSVVERGTKFVIALPIDGMPNTDKETST